MVEKFEMQRNGVPEELLRLGLVSSMKRTQSIVLAVCLSSVPVKKTEEGKNEGKNFHLSCLSSGVYSYLMDNSLNNTFHNHML